ncbi:LEA type 2 family protein [Candidatus Altiarchaeota archaeon]
MESKTKILMVAAFILLAGLIAYAGSYVIENTTKPPKVEVLDVGYSVIDSYEILGVSIPKTLRFNVKLEVMNPNIIPIEASGGSYTVFLSGVKVGGGEIPEANIPAGGSRELETEFDISATSGLKGVIKGVSDGKIEGGVKGHVEVAIPLVGDISIPFEEKMELIEL